MTNQMTNVVAPWDGSGVEVVGLSSVTDIMAKAKLDWMVEGRPLFTTAGSADNVASMISVPSSKAIVRADNDAIMGIVGKDWNILQNNEVFQFVDELQSMGLVKYHSAGSFKEGRLIWVQAEYQESEIVPGDVHRKYLMISNAFDGTFSVRIGWTNIRVVCMNTFMMASKDAGSYHSIRHTAAMREKIETAKAALIAGEEQARQFDMFQKALARVRMTRDMWDTFSEALVPPPDKGKNSTRSDNSRQALVALATTGRGQDIPGVAGTAYSAFNALTEYVNYERGSRGQDDVSRQSNRFQSALWGSGAKMIGKGIDVLNGFLVDNGIQVA